MQTAIFNPKVKFFFSFTTSILKICPTFFTTVDLEEMKVILDTFSSMN